MNDRCIPYVQWYFERYAYRQSTVQILYNGISMETNTFNVEVLNDTEWYLMVYNGIEWYTIGRFL